MSLNIVAVIVAFYLSLFGLVLMVWLKRREVRSGQVAVTSKIANKSDVFFHNIFAKISHAFGIVNRQTFINIAQWIAFHILKRIRNVYVELKYKALSNPHSKKVLDAVRGKADINPQGASFYLKRISSK